MRIQQNNSTRENKLLNPNLNICILQRKSVNVPRTVAIVSRIVAIVRNDFSSTKREVWGEGEIKRASFRSGLALLIASSVLFTILSNAPANRPCRTWKSQQQEYKRDNRARTFFFWLCKTTCRTWISLERCTKCLVSSMKILSTKAALTKIRLTLLRVNRRIVSIALLLLLWRSWDFRIESSLVWCGLESTCPIAN